MNGCAVGQVEPGGYLNRTNRLGGRHGPHGHHQRRAKGTGRFADDLGHIHGDVFPFLNISYGQTGCQHGVFKRKTASQKEAHHAFIEKIGHIFDLVFELTIFKNSITGQIGPQVSAGGNRGLGLAGFQHIQDRAGFGIAHAKQQKIKCVFERQHHQVGLQVAFGRAAGGSGPFLVPDQFAQIFWRYFGIHKSLPP